MTLLKTIVSEGITESTEDYQWEKHRRTFKNPELVQTESDFNNLVLEQDPYCTLRFLRK